MWLILCIFWICNILYAEYITIDTELGEVTGNEYDLFDGYYVFYGIPYTENTPIGNYRFSKMEVRNSSYMNETYDATYYRNECVQINILSGYPIGNEDCLQLNIWTPNPTASLPVGFWIHGGGLLSGSSQSYDGFPFMKDKDMVFVSINYRLDLLGFASLQSIYDETNGEMTGGMNGIHDQIIALKWVNKYIADFGGDPNQVTIFGESAGK